MWRSCIYRQSLHTIYYVIKYMIVNVGLGSFWVRSQFWSKIRFG